MGKLKMKVADMETGKFDDRFQLIEYPKSIQDLIKNIHSMIFNPEWIKEPIPDNEWFEKYSNGTVSRKIRSDEVVVGIRGFQFSPPISDILEIYTRLYFSKEILKEGGLANAVIEFYLGQKEPIYFDEFKDLLGVDWNLIPPLGAPPADKPQAEDKYGWNYYQYNTSVMSLTCDMSLSLDKNGNILKLTVEFSDIK